MTQQPNATITLTIEQWFDIRCELLKSPLAMHAELAEALVQQLVAQNFVS